MNPARQPARRRSTLALTIRSLARTALVLAGAALVQLALVASFTGAMGRRCGMRRWGWSPGLRAPGPPRPPRQRWRA